ARKRGRVTPFSAFLRDFIRGELIGRLEESNGQLRTFFSGPPLPELEALFAALQAEHGHFEIVVAGQRVKVPLFLVDGSAPDPVGHSDAARCTPNYLTKIRNNPSIKITLALR